MLTASERDRDVLERRSAPRRPASRIPTITGMRVSPGGGEVSLVDLSSSGALLRCRTRMLPGTPVTLVLEGGFSPASIPGRVVRCLVTDVGTPSGLWYHVGVAFDNEIAFGDEIPEQSESQGAATHAEPLIENRW